MVIQKSIREFGMFIDRAVYGVVSWLMQLIMDLSNVEIFNESIIDEFASRIYIILGLVMLFKIMISFIQMLINPDKMSDKEQGAGNILKRVVVSLALIFLVPSIFDLARQVQGEIIPVIPKVVLGVNVDANTDTSETWSSVGRTMAFYSFAPFFNYQNTECAKSCTIIGTCGDDGKADIYDVQSAAEYVAETDICSTDKNGFMYSYSWPLSTLVGAYLVYVLVSIAVSVAIRAIKLSICELAAPIPIASYIDPKSSKQTFDKWVSTTLKTYADLFIRLIIVYFIVFVLQTLFDSEVGIIEQILANVGNDNFRKSLVILFIIVGLLQFAKQAPKFIGDMLGLQGAGDFMGMFKGEGWKSLGSTLAAPAGALTAGAGNAYNAAKNKQSFGQGLRSTIAGMTSGAWHGSKAALSGKGVKDTFNASTQSAWKNRNIRAGNKAAGSTFGGRMSVAMRDYFQIPDDVSLSEGMLKSLNTVRGDISSSKKASFSVLDKNASKVGFRNDSKVKNSIENLLKKNASEIYSSGNETLKRYVKFNNNGEFVGFNTDRLTFADLNTLASAGQASGIGDFENLRLDKEIGLAAQKELHQDLIKGEANTYDLPDDERKKIINHNDIVTARENAHADINKMAGDLYGMKYKNKTLTTAEQMIEAYNDDQASFDDALQVRIQAINNAIAQNKDAINRAANQRLKDRNK